MAAACSDLPATTAEHLIVDETILAYVKHIPPSRSRKLQGQTSARSAPLPSVEFPYVRRGQKGYHCSPLEPIEVGVVFEEPRPSAT